MKPSVALLVSSVVSAALGQRCGPGTYHDDKSGMCLVGAEPPAGRVSGSNVVTYLPTFSFFSFFLRARTLAL